MLEKQTYVCVKCFFTLQLTLPCVAVLICFQQVCESQPHIKSKFTFHFQDDEWKIECLFIYAAL